MSVTKNKSEVLIFGFPKKIRLEIFHILSRFSWTYVCCKSLKDFQDIDEVFHYKIALFYLSERSSETYSFLEAYFKREINKINCPIIAITANEKLMNHHKNLNLFDHIFLKKNLDISLSNIITYYHAFIAKEERTKEHNKVANVSKGCTLQWINSISLEITVALEFLTLTSVDLSGYGAEHFNLHQYRTVVYPKRSHKDNLLTIRIDGTNKNTINKISNLHTEFKDNTIHVLSLDDDIEFCELLKRKIEKNKSYKLNYSNDIEHFFKQIEIKKFDIYIIDYNLGQKFQGIDVVKFLREKFGKSILIFILSKSDLKNQLTDAFEYGFNDYFFKPLNMKQIFAKFNYFLPFQQVDIPLALVPKEYKQNTIQFKAQVIAFNMYNCTLKIPCKVKTGDTLELSDFLQDDLIVEVKALKEIDITDDYTIISATYTNPSIKLIKFIKKSLLKNIEAKDD